MYSKDIGDKMRFDIENVKPGMIVASPIYKQNNLIAILNSDVVLTETTIERLKQNGIKHIDIKLSKEQEMAYIADKGVEGTISNELKVEARESIASFNTNKILQSAQKMTTSIIGSKDFKYSLSEYKETADIFSHSIRVASFAVLLAKFYNDSLKIDPNVTDEIYSEKRVDLESIAAAAMLHDIGKLCINKSILEKVLSTHSVIYDIFPALKEIDLSNYDDKYCSIYSYLLLNEHISLKSEIKMMILLSNENENGKDSLKQGEKYTKSTQSFVIGSKIIRLCSMYDDELKQTIEQNTPLENISAKLDFYATNNIVNEGLEKLFIEHIPLYSTGVKVKLSNGQFAIVEESFRGRMFICRPIVRTIPDGQIIDLRQELALTVQEICSDEISFYDIVNRQIETMEMELSNNNEKSKSI